MQPIDLNLLRALDALLREESVTGAARRLHLSAPAMSRTLARIRDAVGDPILVRAGRRLVPTARARAMRDSVREALDQATRALSPTQPLDLATVERTLSIRTGDGACALLLDDLMRRVAEEAPRVTLRIVPEGEEDAEALRSGEADLDIGAQGELGPEIRVKALFRDRFVCATRQGHPLASQRVTLARFAEASHVSVSRRGRTRGPIDDLLAERGLSRRVALVVPSFLTALLVVAASDYVAMAPKSLVEAMGPRFGVRASALPVATPPAVAALAWHPRFDADPVHQWLRDCLRDICQERLGKWEASTP